MDPYTQEDFSSTNITAQKRTNPFIIPAAILIGFALIAAAIFFNGNTHTLNISNTPEKQNAQQTPETTDIRPVDENDHILGNPNAPIMIVEYSDFDCPFCKGFHTTMQQIMDEYGTGGKVAWVYRQFPLEQLHPNAPAIALASECVADIGGNEAFWKFADTVFAQRQANELTNMTKISDYAVQAGVGKDAFDDCLKGGQLIAAVNEDFKDGVNAGVRGTPYSVVTVGGQQGVINGAQPYEAVKQIIETLLSQIEGT